MTQIPALLALTALSALQLGATSPTKHGLPNDRLTILVRDFSGTSSQLIDGGIAEADTILSRAGVIADWVVCKEGDLSGPEPCRALPRPWILRLRLLPEEQAKVYGFDPNNFGFALPGSPGALGCLAYVFVERVENAAEAFELSAATLLGHMMAHELGHLLLGEGSHAVSGIMTARPARKHLNAAARGQMGFFKSQARAMRRQAARRLAVRNDRALMD